MEVTFKETKVCQKCLQINKTRQLLSLISFKFEFYRSILVFPKINLKHIFSNLQ